MEIKCALGFHNWHGCKCERCGKTRAEGHDWTSDCENCSRCHEYRPNHHQWDGCICVTCRKSRNEAHNWLYDCEKCHSCGKIRTNKHEWKDGKCTVCGRICDHLSTDDCTICTVCGMKLNKEHKWKGNQCVNCKAIRTETIEGPSFLLRGNVERNGLFDTIPPRSIIGEKWHIKISSSALSTPILGQDVLFVTDRTCLFALDKNNGRINWKYKIKETVYSEIEDYAPAVTGQIVILSSAEKLRCFDIKTGEERWTYSSPKSETLCSSPLAHGDRVYIFSVYGDIMALEALTGKEIWKSSLNLRMDSSSHLAMSKGVIYLINIGFLSAVKAENGQVLWNMQTNTTGNRYLSIFDNTLVIMRTTSILLFEIKENPSGGDIQTPRSYDPITLDGDKLFFSSSLNGLMTFIISFPEKEVELKPNWANKYKYCGRSTIAKDIIFVPTNEGILALSVNTGELIWKYPASSYGGVIREVIPDNQNIFFTTSNGIVAAIH